MALVGALHCQRDSYATSITSEVLSCRKVADKKYALILSDTGGGQPHDSGTIDGHSLLDAFREGLDCIHILEVPIEEGRQVQVEIDWKKRFDHMQQHSGQHLLSALAEQKFGLNTLGWGMGLSKSYIECSRSPSSEELSDLERVVNEHIRLRLSITVKESESDEVPDSVPDDLTGSTIRWVCISDLDRNPCCGTHVNNTSELQVFKFFQIEKTKGNYRLFFSFGDRVLHLFQECILRERTLTQILSSGPQDFVDRVQSLQDTRKELEKCIKSYRLEIIQALVERWKETLEKTGQSIFGYYRPDADLEFLTSLTKVFSSSLPQEATGVFLGGPIDQGGCLLIVGDPSTVDSVSKTLVSAVGKEFIKGGGRQGRFQAKSTSWRRLLETKDSIDWIIENLTPNTTL